MSLNNREQRQLHRIESRLLRSDPHLARDRTAPAPRRDPVPRSTRSLSSEGRFIVSRVDATGLGIRCRALAR
jgi:Protein of unknown function (DUF3040)